jgi:hypothetical protein
MHQRQQGSSGAPHALECVWQVQWSGAFVPATPLAGAKSPSLFMPVPVGQQPSIGKWTNVM